MNQTLSDAIVDSSCDNTEVLTKLNTINQTLSEANDDVKIEILDNILYINDKTSIPKIRIL
jgi:hypothetical protein